jgi:ribosomal protein L6P/L9E
MSGFRIRAKFNGSGFRVRVNLKVQGSMLELILGV